jgi:cysteine desulfurase
VTLYYFDHAASAPRRPEVLEAMAPYLTGVVGNPSGTHRAARAARRAIEEARDEVAAFVGASPHGVIFTGGGTESCYLALYGAVHRYRRHHATATIVTSPIEHHAVLETALAMASDDPSISARTVSVDGDGLVDARELVDALTNDVAVVSVMTANNETGVVEPVDDLARAVHDARPDALVHTDAVAAAPWLDLADTTSQCDLVSICAHKLGGPVNAGALVMRGTTDIDAAISGGGQEKGRRGGTVDVAAAVGLATAVRLCAHERENSVCETRIRQGRLIAGVTATTGVTVTAGGVDRLPGHVHATVPGIASDELLFVLDQHGVCASAASSCASGAGVPSHVLAAMGVSAAQARGAVRFTMGAETTDDDVDYVVATFAAAVATLREGG